MSANDTPQRLAEHAGRVSRAADAGLVHVAKVCAEHKETWADIERWTGYEMADIKAAAERIGETL